MAEDTKKDQRVKAPVLRAKYKSRTLDEFIEKYSRDISRSGMWIKSPKPPALGTLLKVEILLEDATPVISAVGRVVKRREEAEATPDNPAGMGIRFLKLEESSQPVIDRIVALKGEDAGPHFENIRTGATVPPPSGGEVQSAFFGATTPAKDMPPDADRTMMRQMNALLGEALRQVNEAAPRKPDAAPVPTQKATIMGVAAPAGMLEQALAVAREEGKKADEGPTKVATRSEIDTALEKLKTFEEPGEAKPAEKPAEPVAKVEEPKPEVPRPSQPRVSPPPRSLTTRTASVPPPPSTRPIEIESPRPAEQPEAKAPEPAKPAEQPEAKAPEPAKPAEQPEAKVEAPKVEAAKMEALRAEEKPAEQPEAKAETKAEEKAEEKPAEPAVKAEEKLPEASIARTAKVAEEMAERRSDERPAVAKTEEAHPEVKPTEKAEEKVSEPVTGKEPSHVEPAKPETKPEAPQTGAGPLVVKADETKPEAKAAAPKAEEKKVEAKPAPPKVEEKKPVPAEAPAGMTNTVVTLAIIAAVAFAVYWFLLRGNG